MIIPSIDIMNGRAVQLRQGREHVLDGGDPLERLTEMSVAGEVAVVDLDAALGRGSNEELIREMVRRAPCRVGGGIRDVERARAWLDAGATRVVLGTAATTEVCSQLPRDRVIAALDARVGEVVVDGWREPTGRHVLDRIAELAPHVSGLLVTQVEHEGGLAGYDHSLVESVIERAGDLRVTAAGGITRPEEIASLDRLGVDAQVGLALYNGVLPLGTAIAAPLQRPVDELWPTVTCDESGRALGLAWSSRDSLALAVTERRGIYWSRSRQETWLKGASSGNTQELLRVDLDCDRDALRFLVRQAGTGFCHRDTWGCWPETFETSTLERSLHERLEARVPGSGTVKLLDDPGLLTSKLKEEAEELAAATGSDDVVHETADLTYFALVKLIAAGGTWSQVQRELERRSRRIGRRPMIAKPEREVQA
ncbi:MAG: phosphoribosyl-ATP diphosphatase [Acidobacteriota bacterium]